MSSPKPPSAFWTLSSQATARRTAGGSGSMAHASSARGWGPRPRGGGAVAVVPPPAADPRAVVLLLGEEPVETAPGDGGVPRLLRQNLDGVPGHARPGLVCALAEGAERETVE